MKASGSFQEDRRRLPGAMRLGFLLLGLGGAFDLAYHALAAWASDAAPHTGVFATSVHAVVLAGMAVTFAGVLQVAIRSEGSVKRKERR